jgi:hypothetical protein
VLEDQIGAGAVLTFTFSRPVDYVWIVGQGASTDVARADPFGGTPTATRGIPCFDETPMAVMITTKVVKVFTPSGMTVSVWGMAYDMPDEG